MAHGTFKAFVALNACKTAINVENQKIEQFSRELLKSFRKLFYHTVLNTKRIREQELKMKDLVEFRDFASGIIEKYDMNMDITFGGPIYDDLIGYIEELDA